MITLTIDGRRVTVPPGTSVLDAARWLGIRIPTMCHVPGIEPAASCFLCAVQIEGRRTLSPACAMPAAEGMVVATDTDDVRAARRMALELLLSDHAGECVAPCTAKCPAGLDIPEFLGALAAGDARRAMETVGRHLALPGSLGRICPRLCEQGCRRGDLDQGLAIGALHRYAADQDRSGAAPYLPPRAPASGKRVAIVGAGPAGLAAAWYLLRQGHACTLFDAHPLPGGMLRYGIPAYRLPKDALEAEIASLAALGAEFRMGLQWGEDFTLAELREAHDAVFMAIGAQRAQALRCAGEEHALSGIGFLEQVAQGNAPPLGDDVVVLGGGNTAVDCARSAVRLGARRVRVLYRRSRQEMPCLMEEVVAAEAEGVEVELLVAPLRLDTVGLPHGIACVPPVVPGETVMALTPVRTDVPRYPPVPPDTIRIASAETPVGQPHGIAPVPPCPPQGQADPPVTSPVAPDETVVALTAVPTHVPQDPPGTPDTLRIASAETPVGQPHGIAPVPPYPPQAQADPPVASPITLAEMVQPLSPAPTKMPQDPPGSTPIALAAGTIADTAPGHVEDARVPGGLLLTCQRMALGEPDASGRRRPLAVEGSEFTVACSTVIAAVGQSVECSVAEREGLAVTAWGIAAHARTMATNQPGVFAGGDAVLGADLAVRAVAAGRMAAASIHQYLAGQTVTGEPALAGIAMQPVDESERAALFRAIENAPRVHAPELPMERRVTSFDEVEQALPHPDAAREARRCLDCGCRKADCCLVRSLATEYAVDVYRFAGQRRRFSRDLSHPEIVHEPGKCINCDACVRIAAEAGEELGLAAIGRGFDVTVAVPFGRPLSEGLRRAAVRCAAACPTGALALRSRQSCDACKV